MEASTRERLLQLNPWLLDPSRWEGAVARQLPSPHVPRLPVNARWEAEDRAKLVVGPRRAGKSTLVWSRLADRPPGSVLYLQCEEERVRHWLRSAAGALADLERELPSVRTLFLEEAQHLAEAGLLVKGLVDARRDLDVVVTGSSAFHLEARTRESLAGRAVRVRLLPLSIDELLGWRAPPSPAAEHSVARSIAERQMVYGGYPGVWFAADPRRELLDLVEAFVIRDASDRFRVQHLDAFRRLLQLAAGQVGQMVNLSEWAALLGIAVSTVSDYLALLEESWLVALLPPFAGGRRQEITRARRLHFYDLGLRNALLDDFEEDPSRRSDRGALVEGLVFAELAKSLPLDAVVRYWRAKGGAEVDFVVQRGRRLVPVEVKAADRGHLSRSLRSFVDAYRPAHAIVACGAIEAPREEGVGETTVHVVPAEQVATQIRTLVPP